MKWLSTLLLSVMAWVTFAQTINLPGPARPIMLAGTAEHLWILRQEDGAMPAWWLKQGDQISQVSLPKQTRLAAPLSQGKGIMVITGQSAQLFFANRDRSLKAGPNEPLPDGMRGVHPRLDTQFKGRLDDEILMFAEPDKLLLFSVKNGDIQKIDSFAFPSTDQANVADFGANAYFQPQFTVGGGKLILIKDGRPLGLDLGQRDKLRALVPPKLRNMEQAVPIPTEAGLTWLVHGGDRGDLSSFGWRLLNEKGRPLAQGGGIVTRFGLIADGAMTRLLIWTVSQKVRSQLWAAMSGSRTFSGKVLQWQDNTWREIQDLSVKMGKGKGERAFEIQWQADINGDGLRDLVATDEKYGLRIYVSDKSGRFSEDDRKLDVEPHELLTCGTSLYTAQKMEQSWRLSEVRP